MNRTTVVALALAGLAVLGFVGAGAATASPGAAPDGVPADDHTDNAEDANAESDGETDRGPPTDVPGPVPGFVGELHRTIGAFLDGAVDDLGSAIGEVVPGGDGGPSSDAPAGP